MRAEELYTKVIRNEEAATEAATATIMWLMCIVSQWGGSAPPTPRFSGGPCPPDPLPGYINVPRGLATFPRGPLSPETFVGQLICYIWYFFQFFSYNFFSKRATKKLLIQKLQRKISLIFHFHFKTVYEQYFFSYFEKTENDPYSAYFLSVLQKNIQ